MPARPGTCSKALYSQPGPVCTGPYQVPCIHAAGSSMRRQQAGRPSSTQQEGKRGTKWTGRTTKAGNAQGWCRRGAQGIKVLQGRHAGPGAG